MAVWSCTAISSAMERCLMLLERARLQALLVSIGKPWQVEPRIKDDAKGTQDAETLTAILKGIALDAYAASCWRRC